MPLDDSRASASGVAADKAPYKNMREFIDKLEANGELVRVKAPVSIEYEIGAICRKVLDGYGPALLFENPIGNGVPVAVNLTATRRRYAMALNTTEQEVHQEWISRTAKPIEPVLVETGPCKDNVMLGDEVDLYRFSMPTWNALDSGPYITYPLHVSKDPDTGIPNLGLYRTQVFEKNLVGIAAAPYRHLMQHARKQRGPLPVALAIGCDPVVHIASIAPFQYGENEYAMAGGLRGEPVELVRCETVPLEVPAESEIVLEGYLHMDRKREEGFFGEYTGYYGLKVARPTIEITAITFRNDPIHLASYEGRPPQETVCTMAIPTEADILRLVPLPGIKKVHVTEAGCGSFNAIVSIEKRFEGYGKMVGLAVLGTWGGRLIKNLIVVDDDIDPFNRDAVDWALATRVQPHRDVEIIGDLVGVHLDPSLSEHERATGHSRTSKMIIDATRYDKDNFEIVCEPKTDVMAAVLRDWSKYGIPG
ncbi:MAG: UbiD family decarboxylase [Chloroflexi bacterium]|nr:UbiD family decarboxylase [Chloroflexota bacterium]